MAEYIEREAAVKLLRDAAKEGSTPFHIGLFAAARAIESIPAADVVSRGAYDQCDWERVVALTQLKEIGKGLGERMDDVRPVVRGKWEVDDVGCGVCSECSNYAFETSTHHISGWFPRFCPNCGAWMCNEEEQT